MIRTENYFGDADASRIQKEILTTQHIFRDMQERVKWANRDSGIQIVVGVKGSGKTDLRRYLENTDTDYVLNLNTDSTYLSQDVSGIRESSGRSRNAVATILLQAFTQGFAEANRSNVGKKLASAYSKSSEFLKQVPGAMEVGAYGVKVKLSDLLQREADQILKSALDELMTGVTAALGAKRGAILIDDVEDVFPGITENPIFLEGVARAVTDINFRSGSKLHTLLFVKHGLWRSWFEEQREYDKVSGLVGFLTWDHTALVELIAKRIARLHSVDLSTATLDSAQLWAKEFSWQPGGFDDFTRYCVQYCVSGPRDMIALCNRAALAVDSRETITLSHINAILGAYSEEKTAGLNGDFGDTYRGISKFTEHALQGAPAEASGYKFAEIIESKTLLSKDFHAEFKRNDWYADATKERLARILYQIGVLGYDSPAGPIYAMQEPNLSISDLLAKKRVLIHPAFRPHLNVR